MELPVMLLLFSIPSAIFMVAGLIRRVPFSESRRRLGWTLCKWPDIVRAIAVFAVLAVITFVVLKFIPQQLLSASSRYTGQPLNIQSGLAALIYEAFYVALGEEIFFRGFLGSWLFRRVGFRVGNLAQAAVFLLPHLLLLNISLNIWPIFIIQICAGWAQGWLLHKSGSILPGWLVHTASNLASAIASMG